MTYFEIKNLYDRLDIALSRGDSGKAEAVSILKETIKSPEDWKNLKSFAQNNGRIAVSRFLSHNIPTAVKLEPNMEIR